MILSVEGGPIYNRKSVVDTMRFSAGSAPSKCSGDSYPQGGAWLNE